jgi:glycosyltransferase involved in cell wall biosynthesis
MKVIHLSTNDIRGGAARAAYRLHRGLHLLGLDSHMLVKSKSSDDPKIAAFMPPRNLARRIRRNWRQIQISVDRSRYRVSRPVGSEDFSDDRSEHGSALCRQLPHCDLINLHWVAEFLDYQSLFAGSFTRVPLVWTLHDMCPFTGGCHYDHGCGKYMEQCGTCPQLGSSDPDDLSAKIWQRKHKTFKQFEPWRLHIVTPSRWLAAEVERSTLLGKFSISVIPYGLDTHVFAPRNSAVFREIFNVPQHAKVILFAAGSTQNPRKGWHFLVEALTHIAQHDRDIYLFSLGKNSPAFSSPFTHIYLGHIDNDRFLSFAYSAADLFVAPSLQDNLPNTVMEAMSCGTPVVGFSVGGIPDMVRHGVTGLLAPLRDVEALAKAISHLLENDAMRAEMSSQCRRIANEEYSLEVQASHYLSLYEEVTKGVL